MRTAGHIDIFYDARTQVKAYMDRLKLKQKRLEAEKDYLQKRTEDTNDNKHN